MTGFELSSLHSKKTTFSNIPHSCPHTPSFLRGQSLQTCPPPRLWHTILQEVRNVKGFLVKMFVKMMKQFSNNFENWNMNHEGCAQYFKRLLSHQKCVANVCHFPSRGNALEGIANAPFIRRKTLRLMFWDFPGIQWLRLCTPREGAQVPFLVTELDYTCSN